MPSSAFSHGLVHLSVSCLSQRICLFISLLSPYSCVCFQCLYTQASPLPLHTFQLHVSLLLHSLFSTVFLQQVTFSCLLSVFYMNLFAKVLWKILADKKKNHRKFTWPFISYNNISLFSLFVSWCWSRLQVEKWKCVLNWAVALLRLASTSDSSSLTPD